jgi:hypothetical protein
MNSLEQSVFDINFHAFIQQSEQKTNFELADEFGLNLKDVKLLKKKLERN